MQDFAGKLAVITGGGSGIGRELALQLAGAGCHVAVCDVMSESVEDARAACERVAPAGTRVSAHRCDVSIESDVIALRDAVQRVHATDHRHHRDAIEPTFHFMDGPRQGPSV